MLTLNYHSDAGHGWVAVKIALLADLGIADKISQCSYQRGKSAYLEEDCDAVLLVDTLKAKNIEYTIKALKQKNHSPIRSYESYKQPV